MGERCRCATSRVVGPLASGQLGDTLAADALALTQPWWLARPRTGDIFGTPILAYPEDRLHGVAATITGEIGGVPFRAIRARRLTDSPIRSRERSSVRSRSCPAVSVTVDQPIQYVPRESSVRSRR